MREPKTTPTLEEWLADFVATQEPLGEEFERVLNDNIWDLMVLT